MWEAAPSDPSLRTVSTSNGRGAVKGWKDGREEGHRRPKSDLQMSAPLLEKGQCCREMLSVSLSSLLTVI